MICVTATDLINPNEIHIPHGHDRSKDMYGMCLRKCIKYSGDMIGDVWY